MNRLHSILLFAVGPMLLVAALSGCKSVNTIEPANPRAVADPVDSERVVTDPNLQRYLSVVDINQATVSGDLTRLQVRLRNNSRREQTVQYRFEWYDADGMFIDSPTSLWRIRNLKGGETIVISDVSPNPRAVDFALKLQRN